MTQTAWSPVYFLMRRRSQDKWFPQGVGSHCCRRVLGKMELTLWKVTEWATTREK